MAKERWADQVRSRAREVLHAPVFRYVEEGARDEVTLGEAEASWRAHRLVPRVLRDVREVRTDVTLLGERFAHPIGIAPMTLQRAAHPDGEVAMARAAAECEVPMVLSSNAGSTFADVAATGARWWLQVYVTADRAEIEPLVRAAVDAGASAVVLTVDTPVVGTHYAVDDGPRIWEVAQAAWYGANATRETGPAPADRPKAMDLGPDDLAWLGEVTGLPVVVKGVLRGDDARACVQAGARAVWVSNHGGRQLDRVRSTADSLAEVGDAVGRDAQVYVDGGVRSGLDALVAFALGADAVFVGRPAFHALAADGADGVVRLVGELATELQESLRLAGCSETAQAPQVLPREGRDPARSGVDLREPTL